MLVPLIILATVAAVLLAAVVTFVTVQERIEVRDSLRRLDGYQIQGVRDQEMLAPIDKRVIAPLVGGLTGFARRFTPQGYVDQVRQKLILAGSPPSLDVDKILVLKLLGIVSGLVWIPVVFVLLGLDGFFGIVVLGFLWVVSFLAPDLTLTNRIEARQKEIGRQLPDVLDLLVISVEAGLGFEQAIDRVSVAVPGSLSDEFRRMLQETRIGASQAQALRAMEERTDVPELRSFILAMLQADTFGVSIARILRTQAEDMRQRRRVKAQEQAQKAPVKMLFPLVFCIFPSIFLVVLYPAFKSISDAL
ncbi:MAG: type II secretion system F family protein [Acidimicrobiia bacterium]|nr:type II secretion system F family protein [Acidimicrobiia bacterium]